MLSGLLGAAASLETSFENPAAWKCCMRASIHADGVTSSLKCNLVETGLDVTGETKVDPHPAGSGVETRLKWSLRGDQNDLADLSDLVQQGKQMKQVHRSFLQRW